MNILFYLNRFPGWGGIETVTELIGSKLAESGHDIHILSHRHQDRPSELLNKASFHTMPDGKSLSSRENMEFAVRLIRDFDICLVVYQDCYEPTERIALKMKEAGARLAVFEHNTPLHIQKTLASFPEGSLVKQFYRHFSHPAAKRKSSRRHLLLLRESDAYVVLSEGYVTELRDLCGWKESEKYLSKIHVIGNPVTNVEEPAAAGTKENTVLFVGQINYQKRVGMMLDLWKQINSVHPDWKLQIVGDGPMAGEMVSRTVRENIRNVEFLEYQDPAPFYRSSKIFWMTSLFEGWPMTVMEAMRGGCVPVVMDTFASIHDIIENGHDGFIVPSRDNKSFLEVTGQLIGDETRLRVMADAAGEKVRLFSLERIIEKWNRLLAGLQPAKACKD